MRKKPSFKIKKFGSVHYGERSCANTTDTNAMNCPPNSTHNVWDTNKITLNNMVQGTAEVYSHYVCGKYTIAPLSQYVAVELYRGTERLSNHTYAAMDTIDDKIS